MPSNSCVYVSVAFAFVAASLGCSGSGPRNAQAEGQPGMPVQIEVASPVALEDSTDYVATLKSRASALIMPQVEGQVTEVFVHAGDRVTSGTPLLQIDPAKQQATVKSQQDTRAAKQAALEFARQQNARVRGLHGAGVVSQQELDHAQAALDAAQAELLALEAQVQEQQVELRYYRVTAPTDGMVGDIPVRVGDRVTSSTLLTSIDRLGELEAYVSVPVERASGLRIGLPLRLIDGDGAVVATSQVNFLSPRTDDQTQTVLIKAPIPNPKGVLRSAQLLRARLVFSSHEGLLIPLLAVSRISGQHFAFVADGGDGSLVARQRQIRVGEIAGNSYEVLDGIKAGDRVIVSGTQLLADGTPVAPKS